MGSVIVRFMPDDLQSEVEKGTSLLEAAARVGITIRSSCGGDGSCGQCAVIVNSGDVKSVSAGDDKVLACRSLALSDCVIEIPTDSRVDSAQVVTDQDKRSILAESDLGGMGSYQLQPHARRCKVTVSEPTLTENASDLVRVTARLRQQLGKQVEFDLAAIRQLPDALRRGGWTVSVGFIDSEHTARIIDVRPGDDDTPAYGVAVDVGTTTVVTLIVDLDSGLTVDRRGEYNRQGRYGDDVISRMVHAADKDTGLRDLQWAVVSTINHLLAEGCLAAGINDDDILCAVVAGNTTMMHLFTAVSPEYLRLEPYIPAAIRFPVTSAGELGLSIHDQAAVFIMPSVASYVGGDLVAGALITGVGSRDEVQCLIDIGTNGEILLGNKDWLVSCACSAGPCFEGSGITCGMRAEPGAVERIRVDSDLNVHLVTVGGEPARGICGSGLVDAIARLVEVGVIDRAGRLSTLDTPKLRQSDEGREFLLKPGGNHRSDLVIREGDIKNVLRAKAAIYAGIRSLVASVDLHITAIQRMFIGGGFGSYLVIADAVTIGLLPDIDPDDYEFAGNSSVKGARLALLSRQAWTDANELAGRITYIELSVGNEFMEEFSSAMFIPHTDLDQFPSVKLVGGNRTREALT